MSGRIKIGFVDLPAVLLEFDRVCCVSVRPFLVRNWCSPMPQAAKLPAASPVEVAVDFDSSVQSLSALDAAAYRLIGIATCRIDRVEGRYVCRLAPSANPQKGVVLSSDDLKERFLNLVADEKLAGSRR